MCVRCTVGFDYRHVYIENLEQPNIPSSLMPVHPLNMHFDKLCRSAFVANPAEIKRPNPTVVVLGSFDTLPIKRRFSVDIRCIEEKLALICLEFRYSLAPFLPIFPTKIGSSALLLRAASSLCSESSAWLAAGAGAPFTL